MLLADLHKKRDELRREMAKMYIIPHITQHQKRLWSNLNRQIEEITYAEAGEKKEPSNEYIELRKRGH